MTLFYTHPAADGHVNPPGHPEQVARLHAVTRALDGLALDRRAAPLADESEVLRCHPPAHLARIKAAIPAQGFAMLDGDTSLAPGSLTAALYAIGGVNAAVDAVLADGGTAFVAMRPPGHHAETATPMGFCLFGTVAIAAKRALDHHGLDRVAVLDFDVHHGNGTQDLLWSERRAFFASTHQMPLYPGSGAASERGAHGQMVNIPLPPRSSGQDARAAWRAILNKMRAFAPQLVLVSAGFDAHHDDPLAELDWETEDFRLLTREICAAAKDCGAPLVSSLEGGYDLAALGASARAHVEALMEAGNG